MPAFFGVRTVAATEDTVQARSDTIETYAAFWPYYLQQHAKRATRIVHYCGNTSGLAVLVTALATNQYWLLIGVPIVAYGFAWTSHVFIENNKPATFRYPVWSLISDLRMYLLAITGQLKPELERAGVT